MRIISSGSIDTDVFYPSFGTDITHSHHYDVLHCPACKKVNLCHYFWHELMDGTEESIVYQVLHPSSPSIPKPLPPEIEKEYAQALTVKHVNPNAFGVLMGRVLQKVCDDRAATGHTLDKRLEDLAAKGEIPDRLACIAHRLRKLRNIGGHAELGELTTDEVPLVQDLSDAVLNYVYTGPFLAQQAEDRLNELKKRKKK